MDFCLAEAFTVKTLFLGCEIVLVYLGGIEVKTHFIGCYAAGAASKVSVKYLVSGVGKLL